MKKLLQYIKNMFSKKEESSLKTFSNLAFSVESFNKWFCDPNNGASYAHKGIFLRTDKLSAYHLTEYFNFYHHMEAPNELLIWKYREMICSDWIEQLKNKS